MDSGYWTLLRYNPALAAVGKAPLIEYSGQKKPLVRNGGNCNTDFKETILIVLILCSIQNVGTARDS